MEERRRGKKLAFIFGAIFLVVLFFLITNLTDKALSYDTSVAHPNIARLAAELYNQQFDPDLSAKDIDLLEKGAEDEDTPFRWYNHFYDPLNNKGLWFGKQFSSAKDWVNTSKIQNDYALGDQSWNRALYSFSDGDREGALVALGHVIHLLSDMTVPAHTRADVHPSGDSYEQYVKTNWSSIYPQIKDRIKYREVLNLDSAFDVLATFSNGYFYSDDTIEDKKYRIIKVSNFTSDLTDQNKKVILANAEYGGSTYLLFAQVGTDWKNAGISKYIKNNFVLNSYSTQLIPKAIGYSAGVIKLFFSETAKGNKGKDVALLQTTPVGYGNTLLGAIGNGVQSLFGNIQNEISLSPVHSEDVSSLSTGQNATPSVPDVVVPPTTVIPPNPKPVVVKKVVVVPVAPVVEPLVETPAQTTAPDVVPQQNTTPTNSQSAPTQNSSGPSGINTGSNPTAPVVTNTTDVPTTTEVVTTTTTSTTTTTTTTTTTEPNITPTSTIEIPTTTPTSTPETPTTTINIPTTTPETTTTTLDTPTTTIEIPTSTIETPSTTPTTTPIIETPTTTPTTSPYTSFTQEVVINEIAWAGTSADYPFYEWFELYNNTDQDITLFGANQSDSWKINVGAYQVSLQKKLNNPIIPAHGYYLFERFQDETIREVTADYVYSLTYGFNNSGEKIQLVKPDGTISDEVDCSNGWFAGDNVKYRSMERISPTASSSDPTNWQSNKGPRLLPRGYSGGEIYGSPKTANVGGGLISINGNQAENEVVLTKGDSPYILGHYIIPAGKKLTIEPGVIIKTYYNSSLFDVSGALQVNGTADEPVFFTSGRDLSQDSYFIGQLPAGDPQAKDWQGLWFREGSIGNLNNLSMRYAGKKFYKDGYIYTVAASEAIRAEGASLNIQNSKFLHNGDLFIHALAATNLTLENSVFTDGGLALQVDGGTAVLNNNEYLTFTQDPPTQVLILPN